MEGEEGGGGFVSLFKAGGKRGPPCKGGHRGRSRPRQWSLLVDLVGGGGAARDRTRHLGGGRWRGVRSWAKEGRG